MAYLSGMCSAEYSCTIAEARSLGSTSLIGQQNYRTMLNTWNTGSPTKHDSW